MSGFNYQRWSWWHCQWWNGTAKLHSNVHLSISESILFLASMQQFGKLKSTIRLHIVLTLNFLKRTNKSWIIKLRGENQICSFIQFFCSELSKNHDVHVRSHSEQNLHSKTADSLDQENIWKTHHDLTSNKLKEVKITVHA